jgi:hypothetical protein
VSPVGRVLARYCHCQAVNSSETGRRVDVISKGSGRLPALANFS